MGIQSWKESIRITEKLDRYHVTPIREVTIEGQVCKREIDTVRQRSERVTRKLKSIKNIDLQDKNKCRSRRTSTKPLGIKDDKVRK